MLWLCQSNAGYELQRAAPSARWPCSAAECCQALCALRLHCCKALRVSEVLQDPVMSKIKRYVVQGLGQGNYRRTESVRYPCFVHHIRISTGEVHDHDPATEQQTEDVVDDCGLLPDVVRTRTTQPSIGTRTLDRHVDRREGGVKRHHHGHQVLFGLLVWNAEHRRSDNNMRS